MIQGYPSGIQDFLYRHYPSDDKKNNHQIADIDKDEVVKKEAEVIEEISFLIAHENGLGTNQKRKFKRYGKLPILFLKKNYPNIDWERIDGEILFPNSDKPKRQRKSRGRSRKKRYYKKVG